MSVPERRLGFRQEMNMLTHDEILAILEIIRKQYGPGYAKDEDIITLGDKIVKVGHLQAKLSIMLEVSARIRS